jgi:hypothetical protein
VALVELVVGGYLFTNSSSTCSEESSIDTGEDPKVCKLVEEETGVCIEPREKIARKDRSKPSIIFITFN